MARRLTTTSYAILGLLSTGPMSAYDLATQYPRSMRWAWPLSQAHLYTEPQRLAREGLVRVEVASAGPVRTRKVFHLTAAGRKALTRWMTTAPKLPELNNEVMLRIAFADAGRVDDLLASLDALEREAHEWYRAGVAQVQDYVDTGGPFPERLRVIALASDYHARFIETYLDWVASAREEIATWETTRDLRATPRSASRFSAILDRASARLGSRTTSDD